MCSVTGYPLNTSCYVSCWVEPFPYQPGEKMLLIEDIFPSIGVMIWIGNFYVEIDGQIIFPMYEVLLHYYFLLLYT